MMHQRFVGDTLDLLDMFKRSKCSREQFHAFSSAEAMASHVKAHGDNCWSDSPWREAHGDDKWAGSKCMPDAIKLAHNGWPEGAEKAYKLKEKIRALTPKKFRLTEYCVAGEIVDIPRYIAGNPMCMMRTTMAENRRRPVITLVSDIAGSCMVGGHVFTNRAAVVAAIVDVVEDAGFSCHVIGYFSTTDVHKRKIEARCAFTIKAPDQPSDINKLAFGLGHPAVFRRLGFAVLTENKFTSELTDCIGYPYPLTNDMLKVDGAYVLPSVQKSERLFETEDNAATKGMDYLVGALRGQGCPAFKEDN